MGIGHEFELIFARFQLVAFEAVIVGVVIVVGLEILRVDFDFDVGLLPWLKLWALGVGDEFDVGLLNAAWSIWGGEINANNVFAGHITGVGDLDGEFDFAFVGDVGTLSEGSIS